MRRLNPGLVLLRTWRARLALLLVTLGAGLLALDLAFPLNLPDRQSGFARIVVDRHGEPLRAFADADGVWRYPISVDEVSPYYLEALLSYEDRWFYWHPGVNPVALVRAAWQNHRSGRVVSGGSTLTMQVARLLHPHRRTLGGKIRQSLRALQLEAHLSKREILELYLNLAPFGGTREGVQTASYQYLGKPAARLTRAEAALLAVLPQAPSRLRPDRYPLRAQQARDKLLRRLSDLGVWSQREVDEARMERVAVYAPKRPLLAPLLARRLVRENPRRAVIRTHIDLDIQTVLQDLANGYARSLPNGTSVAILMVENQGRRVRAYVGSADLHSVRGFGHVDMISAIRSPGSTLKPFLYGMAIDAGLVHSASLLTDAPRTFSNYQPANFSRGFVGPVSLEFALKNSLNVPAVELLEHYGPARFADKLANAGLDLRLPKRDKPNLSMILGGTGVSLEGLVRTYGAFTAAGQVGPLQYLRGQEPQPARQRFLMSPGAAWVVQRILQDVPRPGRINSNAVDSGRQPIAWKSGTSYGFRDAWSIGVSADYSIGVWVGRPDGTPLPGHHGALSAAPLMFAGFDLLGSVVKESIARPDSVEQVEICWPLGLARELQQAQHCHEVKQAWVVDGVTPASLPQLSERGDWYQNPVKFRVNAASGLLVDASCAAARTRPRQAALWPKILEPWIDRRFRREAQIPAYDDSCPNPVGPEVGAMRIAGLSDRALLRAAGSSSQAPAISARVIGARGQRGWYLNGSKLRTAADSSLVSLQLREAGAYQILVIDETGNSAKVDFRVIN